MPENTEQRRFCSNGRYMKQTQHSPNIDHLSSESSRITSIISTHSSSTSVRTSYHRDRAKKDDSRIIEPSLGLLKVCPLSLSQQYAQARRSSHPHPDTCSIFQSPSQSPSHSPSHSPSQPRSQQYPQCQGRKLNFRYPTVIPTLSQLSFSDVSQPDVPANEIPAVPLRPASPATPPKTHRHKEHRRIFGRRHLRDRDHLFPCDQDSDERVSLVSLTSRSDGTTSDHVINALPKSLPNSPCSAPLTPHSIVDQCQPVFMEGDKAASSIPWGFRTVRSTSESLHSHTRYFKMRNLLQRSWRKFIKRYSSGRQRAPHCGAAPESRYRNRTTPFVRISSSSLPAQFSSPPTA